MIMVILERHACRTGSDARGPSSRARSIELHPHDSVPRPTEQPLRVERFWNPLAQAHQSEEELWSFLGNWDL